jgi:hypothetical protein
MSHIAKAKQRSLRVRDMYRLRLVEYVTHHPCVDCGEPDVRVLDFDHRPGTEKRDAGAHMLFDLVRRQLIEAAIEKCDVRCANCHRRVTAER